MTHPASDPMDGDDKPLDPAVERVRQKLMRLMIVSVGVMMIGLLAVLGAVVYKVSGRAPEQAVEIVVPASADILSVTHSGDSITVFLRDADGSERVLIVPVGATNAPRSIPIRREP